jgi:hypothetical protein
MYTRTIHTHDLRSRTLDIQHTRDQAHITKTYHRGEARPCTLDIQHTRTHDLDPFCLKESTETSSNLRSE